MRNFLKPLIVTLFSIQPFVNSFAQQSSSSNEVLITGSAQPFDAVWQRQFVRDYAELMKALPDPLRITAEAVKNVLNSKSSQKEIRLWRYLNRHLRCVWFHS